MACECFRRQRRSSNTSKHLRASLSILRSLQISQSISPNYSEHLAAASLASSQPRPPFLSPLLASCWRWARRRVSSAAH
eukprot:5782399-Pleurochrysis_carterae.AAC.1